MGSIPESVASLAAGFCTIAVLLVATSRPNLAAAEPVPPTKVGSFCTADEVSIFSCSLGPKRVSVCGRGNQAVYRYGAPGKVELAVRNLSLAKRGFSGGGETQITATNNNYSYIVYDRTERTSFGASGGNDPQSGSGLLVRHAGRTLSSKLCDDDAPIPSRASAYIPTKGEFVTH